MNYEPTLRSESREQVYLYYAEPQGGNEDLFLVIQTSPLPSKFNQQHIYICWADAWNS